MPERFGILCTAPKLAAPPRTAHALTRHGAEVCVVAPPDSYIALTRFKKADVLMPAPEIARKLPAIARTLAEDFGAHSILAGDDGAFMLLAQLITQLDRLELSDATRALIVRSAPPAERALQLVSDAAFICDQAGSSCAPPRSVANPAVPDAVHFAQSVGYPVMVKCDGGAGGSGVRRCRDKTQLLAALQAAHANKVDFILQEFLPGSVFAVALSGVCGRVAAAFAFEKHVTLGAHGVATVLRHDARPEILSHARALYERYCLNGFCGIDYIADANGELHLLEINRCIVPKSHFAREFGVDLAEAMLCSLRGQPIPAPQAPAHEYVALFPLEWYRDPESEFLSSAYHDVPWRDPAVLAAMIQDAAKAARPPANP